MANYLTTDTDLTSVANAIRTKGGTSAQLAFPADFVTAINAISGGGWGDDPYDFSGGNILAIVSHGTEYIDTDLLLPRNSFFCTKMKDTNATQYEHYWGTTYGNTKTGLQRQHSSSNLNVIISGVGTNVAYPGYSSGQIITPFIGIATTAATNTKPLIFFRGYYNGNVESQIATYTLYGLNVLDTDMSYTHRFRPWLDNGVACLKDLETDTIYSNSSGSGAFDYIDLEGVLHSA